MYDILSSHDSVKHLIEIDKSIIHVDAHLENDPIDFLFLRVLTHDTNFPLHVLGELIDELVNILDFHTDALVGGGVDLPGALECFKVVFKARQRVVWRQEVLFELLDDDEDE